MGKLFLRFLSGSRIWCCNNCRVHLAYAEDIISTSFQGRYGKAYLFNAVVNYCIGKQEERQLMTGKHVVADIHCTSCYAVLGWKYEEAYEDSQKYKVGKFILERAMISKEKAFDESL